MSIQEQASMKQHDGNPDYPQHHPDAIQDEVRAKELALATKDFEEGVVEHANNVIKRMDQGLVDIDDEHHVANQLSVAARYREVADEIAGDPKLGELGNGSRREDSSASNNPVRLAKALKSGRRAPVDVVKRVEQQ